MGFSSGNFGSSYSYGYHSSSLSSLGKLVKRIKSCNINISCKDMIVAGEEIFDYEALDIHDSDDEKTGVS
jgi:hypothetical protein